MNAPRHQLSKMSPEFRQTAIGYARVSTEGQGKSRVGLDAQRASIEQFARSMGYDLVNIFEEVGSARGNNNLVRRKTLKGALEEANRLGAVLIVHDWSRLTRTATDLDQITTQLPECFIISVQDAEDLEKAAEAGRFAYAEKKGEHISRTTKEGMARKKALDGTKFGNPNIRDHQKSGASKVRENANALREAIADVLEEHGEISNNLSNSDLAEQLNLKGLETGHRRPFNARSVASPRKAAEDILWKRTSGGKTQTITSSTGVDTDENWTKPPNWGRF